MTTRHGGVSLQPFDSLNLRAAVGDDPQAVAHNQRRLAEAIGARPVYLNQVHGANVVRLTAADLAPDALTHDADGAVTTEPGIACTVQVADCLPVLFAAPGGRAVGAAHAGWRGLAAGVLEATLAQVCEAAQLHARRGSGLARGLHRAGAFRGRAGRACRVRRLASGERARSSRFVAKAPGKWLADLPAAGTRPVAVQPACAPSAAGRAAR